MKRLLGRVTALLGGLALALALAACAQHLRHSAGAAEMPLPAAAPGGLRLATHNVHYIDLRAEDGPWSRAGWEARKTALDSAFKALGADLVAYQEMESFAGGSANRDNLALDWLLGRNPGYAAAATGDPARFPSTQPILYRRDRLEPLDQGWFFFSDTPDRLYARGFDGAPPSFASWAGFRDRDTGARFTLFNVHFDHGSWQNRRGAAELLAERARARIAQGETVLVAGDLNARAGSETLAILEAAGLRFAAVPGATFHFNRGLNLFGAIDHLGHGPGIGPLSAPTVLRKRFDGAWPSDHYPVAAEFAPQPG
ncbi:endonuclease/exonuclease/phosphatase family protein [Limimaricola pyoseonensis]|uniref:Endonuclease/Exonuclease/phosphatase family protein n=1 Tax=Limimaricola pyoseonensis TaxID=521013 RepID=A0A1G7G277_9RHOB|nr:endonuclease/exonuclease/phosphatase family protein [Limimaricola pyoseonensis]SDE82268.1 Endonuclease/Exonuclease/phosphatase family protein [Limimaricola pyoseonensis]